MLEGTNFMIEKMTDYLTDYIVQFLDWVVLVIRLVREGLDDSPSIKVYPGGEGILPGYDVIKVQPELMNRLGVKKAMIVQKIGDWCDYNKRKGKNQYDGFTWMFNSYTDFHEKHFYFFSKRHLENLIRELEDDGFVISTTDMPDTYGKKAYRLNYARIFSYTPSKEVPATPEEGSLCRGKDVETPSKKVLPYNNSKSQEKLTKYLKQLKTPTTTPYAHLRKAQGNEQMSDIVDVVADTKPDSGEYIGLGDVVREQIDNDGVELPSMTSADTQQEQTETPPDSATPPSALMTKLENVGFLPTDAQKLIDTYDADEITRTVEYALKAKSLKNPPGYVVKALRDKRVPAGYVAREDSYRDLAYTAGKWADFIES